MWEGFDVLVIHMCLKLKLIRHMWEASLPNVGLNKSVVSWAQAYKAHVGGVSPRYGIEQIHDALAKADNTC